MINYPVLQALACRRAILSFSRAKILFLIFACLSVQQGFSQWTTSGTNIYNSNTGNVGIGTTSPLNTLHVNGTAYIQAPSATTGLLINVNSPTVYNQGGAFSFNTNGDTYNSLSNSATTAAHHELRFIRTNGTLYNLSAFGTNYVAADIGLNTLAGLRWRTNGNVSGAFSEVELSFYTWSAGLYHDDVLRLFANGNIGIGVGTTNSGYKLDVNGSVRVQSFILPTAAGAGKVLTSDASGNATWQTATGGSAGWTLTGNTAINPATTFIGSTDNSPIAFRTNNTERMRIDGTSGNIAIGSTNTSTSRLLVVTSQQGDGAWITGTGTTNIALLNNTVQGAWNGLTQTGDNMLLWKGSSADNINAGGLVIAPWSNATTAGLGIRISTTGNVSIGTANAQNYMLAVNGSAIFTQAVVKLYPNWPDYVFRPSYQLPSLDSVAKYIRENDHLPDIPSADSMAKTGIDLGANQTVLLKKIEELTLYAIQQQRQLDELKKENEKTEAMLNKLNASINK